MAVSLTIELSGGLDLLFGKVKKHSVSVPPKKEDEEQKDGVISVRTVLAYMRDSMLKERPELFMQGDSVRPGILVLINDTDWELEGTHRVFFFVV